MRSMNLKKIAAMSALGLVALVGTTIEASAQNRGNNRNQNNRMTQQQQRVAAAQARAHQDRIRAEQLRQAQINNNRRPYPGNTYPGNNGYGNVNSNTNRYRVMRGGRYYNTNQRGADLLRQAVNAGYQQGYRAGQADRNNRRRSNWSSNTMYSQGTYGYQSYVDRSQYQYYFQQGFQKGYQDGYNTRTQYGNGGSILGAILGQILNIQTY